MILGDAGLARIMETVKGDPKATEIANKLAVDMIPILENAPGRRFIKTHLPISLLPTNLLDTCKVIVK
jgi:hypothetical protein